MSISIRIYKIMGGVLTAILLAASLILFLPSPGYAAATWTVTDANDTAGSASDITLRYAMTHAQSGDTINFADSVIGQCYYTTDGSDPVTSSTRKAYDGLIPVSQTETIKAVNHTSAGWSAVTSATFNIGGADSPREPMIFPYEGSFTGPQTVYTFASGADQLYYTTDGTDPGTSSTRTSYQGDFTSITVSQSETIKVIAQYGSSGPSNVASASFTIGGTGPLMAPVITPNGGNFSGPLMVDIYNRSGTIYLSSPLPKINMDLTIDGPGAESLTISGNFKSRVFEVDGGSVSISGITVENGFARGNSGSDGYNGIAGGGGGGGGAAEGGGGLLVKGGTVTIEGIDFLYNQAVGGPGGNGGAGYTGSDDYGDGGIGASSDLLDNSAGGQGGIAPFAAVNFGIFNLSSDRPGSDASDGTHYGGGGGGSGINSDNESSGYSFGGQGGQDVNGTTGTGPNGNNQNTNGSKGGNGGSGGAGSVTGGYYYGGNGGNGGDAYGGAICVIDGYVQILNSSFTGNSAVGGMGGAGGISYQGMSNGQSLDSFIYSIGGTLLSGNRGDFESGSLAWFVDFGLSRAGSAFNFEAKTSTAYPFGGYPGNGGNGEGGAIYVSPYNGSFGFNGAPVVIVNSTFADNGAYGGLPGPKTDWTGLSGSNGQHSADDIANKTNSAHVAVRNVTGADSTLGDIRTLSGPSAMYSEITASSLSVAADGTASTTIKVSLRDTVNIPVVGDRVTLNQGSGHSNISPSYAYTDSDGNAVFTVTDTKAETVAYTATDETNVTISGKPLQIWNGYQNVASTESTVTYTPGPASAGKSTVSASPSTVPANDIDSATVTVTLEDAGGNPLSGKTVILNEGSGNSIIIPQNNGLTDANGAATFTVTDNRPETVTYSAQVTTDNVTITQTATVTFTSHAVNAAQSGVTVNPQSVFADGLASSTITVILRDAYGYPVSGKTVSLNQGTGNSKITPQNNGGTDANGAATFTVTDTKPETVTYTAGDTTDNVTITQNATVTFTPHDVSALNSDMTVNPGSVIADGLAYSTITVTLRDAYGYPVSGKTVSLNQGTGNSKITPQNNGVTDANGTATFSVTDTRVESVTYTALDISDNVTVSRTAVVNFESATRIVNTTSDDGGPGTLRYAMQNAPAGLTITFQSGLTGTITLQSLLPVINQDLTIDGSGANVTISGNSQYRVFAVSGARVTIKGLTIADGRADGSNDVFGGVGGGLYIYGGTVYIDNVTFNNNNATGGYGTSGGWGMSTGGNGGNGWGGAVCLNNGSLTVNNSSFTDNQAVGGLGGTGYYGGNGGNGEGGAVFVVEGSLTVTNSSFTGNNVIGGSGGGGFNSGNSGSALGSSLCNLLGTVALSGVTHDPGSNSLYNLSTINTVTFDSQGGGPVSSISNSSVSTISEPAAPTRTGFSFGGWYKEADCTNEWNFSTDTVTGDITLYAKWTVQTHTVTFKDWDGTVLKTETVNYGAGATAPGNPTRTGYTFTGWDVDFSNVTSDLTVTAQYSQNPVTYTVTYNGNGGTGTAPTESDKAAGATFSAAAANSFTAPSGKQFKEWNTDAGGTGTSYAAGVTVTMPASNLTLYAIWENIPAVTLSSIAITTQATKLSYNVGDPLDISGMVITGTYSDNSTKTESITTANVTGFDSSAPAASQTLTVTVGGKTTTYTVTINAAPAVQLAAPTGLGWNSTTPGIAEWSAVDNASSYSVQLLKDDSNLGRAVSVTTTSALSYDFTSAIEAAGSGSYTFTVTAVGDGTDYSDSAVSTVSSDYNYTATPATVSVTSITLTGAGNVTTVQNGFTLQMSAAVSPANASNSSVTWSVTPGSGNATIDSSSGLLTGTGVGTVTAKATANDGSGVSGTLQVTVIPAPAVPLATPSRLSWDITTPGKAEWSAVNNASSYSVQLIKDGSDLGSTVTVTTPSALTYDFTSAIEAAGSGSYTFTVTAVGDGTNYSNSAVSTASNAYNYTAPTTLSSIAITTPASKLSYYIGDALDISGMVVTGTYSDSSTKTESITTANVTGFDSSAPAAGQTLTVNVGGKTATYTVTINAAPATHTVTFQDWDGTVLKVQTVNDKAAASAPSNPGRTGYFFTGWNISFSNVTSDLTVTAQYSQNPLSLTMSPDNGVAGDTIGFSGKTTTSSAITVQVVKADGTEIYTQSLTSDANGNFSGRFNVPGDMTSGILYGSAQAAGRKVSANVLVHEAAYVPPVVINTPTVTVSTNGSNKNLEIPATASTTSAAITVNIPAAVTDATISVSQMVNSPVAGVVTTQPLPAMNIEAVTALSSSPVKVDMPAEVTISAPASSNWDGTINVPTVKANNTVSVSADAGKTATVNTVIEVGYGDIPLTFNKAVRLLIPGMAGKDAGYTRNGSFTKITRILSADSQNVADAEIPNGGEARIDVGSDMVIWTKHFTSFVAYTQASSAYSSGGGGGSSQAAQITVIFKDWDGSVLKTDTVNYGAAATAPVNPNRKGYTFTGWDKTFNNVTIDLTVTAQYSPVAIDKPIIRLAGTDRIETALKIAQATYPGKIPNAILATADNYPDALAGSVLAYQLKAPILLVGSTEADQEKVLDYLKSNLQPEGTVYLLGGTGVIDKSFEDELNTNGIKKITRLAGADRYETSAKIADQLRVKTGTPLVLVSGENYPDALSVSSIAAQMGMPILLSQKDGLSESISQDIAAIQPDKVYIIGQEGAISPNIENQVARITGLTSENIVRIGGVDRYATSLAIAQYFNIDSRNACIATGENYPDALAGSVYAAKRKAPIILTDSNLTVQTVSYLESGKPAGMVIFGGEAAVSKDIEQQLKQLLNQ
ncbi:hypothetical protein JCM15765_28370 [Paradesulfitobacterium aromaticivorans]